MGLILPNDSNEVVQRILQDVRAELSNSNPWLRNSLIRAIPVGLGNRAYDYYYQLKETLKQAFPNTAEDEWLQMWADLKNMTPLTATPSKGPVTFIGASAGLTIPAGTTYVIGELEYTVDADVDTALNLKSVANLTSSGTTAVCVTDDDHEYATGMSVSIQGVNEAGWNALWADITVTGAKSFQFQVPGGLVSPATGTIEAYAVTATGKVTCADAGTGTNQDNGTELSIQGTPIAGVDDVAVVQWAGLTGGIDDETTEDYQDRIVNRWQNPQTPFNPARIESVIRGINGNTRVWVHRVTPVVGAVTAYFVRDNDATIIPDPSEVQTALDAVLAITPANTDESDVHIEAPTGKPINVTVSSVAPDNLSMRQAVEDTIKTYYRGSLAEGEDHLVEKLRSAIFQTYDVVKGQRIQSFVLDLPTVDEPVAQGEIAIEGTVTVNN